MARQIGAAVVQREEHVTVEETALGEDRVPGGAGVALGEHEAVAVLPLGVLGIVLELLAVQNGHDLDDGERAAQVAIATVQQHLDDVATNLGREQLELLLLLLFHETPLV